MFRIGGEGIFRLLGEWLLLQDKVLGESTEGTSIREDGRGLEFVESQLQPELRWVQKVKDEESIGRGCGGLGLLVG